MDMKGNGEGSGISVSSRGRFVPAIDGGWMVMWAIERAVLIDGVLLSQRDMGYPFWLRLATGPFSSTTSESGGLVLCYVM